MERVSDRHVLNLSLHILLQYFPYTFCYLRLLIQQSLPSINGNPAPLPSMADTPEADDELFANEAWVEPPFRSDYGTNIRLGAGVFLNHNTVIIDTCLVTIGARTLFGPNCSIFSGTHPLDPALRNGLQGPEFGKEVHIGEDCWLGGSVIVLPGIRIGKGATVGAGSVVTKVWTSVEDA